MNGSRYHITLTRIQPVSSLCCFFGWPTYCHGRLNVLWTILIGNFITCFQLFCEKEMNTIKQSHNTPHKITSKLKEVERWNCTNFNMRSSPRQVITNYLSRWFLLFTTSKRQFQNFPPFVQNTLFLTLKHKTTLFHLLKKGSWRRRAESLLETNSLSPQDPYQILEIRIFWVKRSSTKLLHTTDSPRNSFFLNKYFSSQSYSILGI